MLETCRVIRRHGHVTELRGNDSVLARRRRGAFFTPPEVARFLASWSVRGPADRLLDPAAGEAVFLVAGAVRLASFGCRPEADQLQGHEIHEETARHAAGLLDAAGVAAELTVGDFFARPAGGEFDAVIGNPPFIRYQGFAGAARERARALCRQHGVEFSGLSNVWAPFLVHAVACLAPNGRLGVVLPGELLTRNYAAAVREFVLRRFERVHVVVFDQRVFPGVLEEVVLLLAEGSGSGRGIRVHRVADLDALSSLSLDGDGRQVCWQPSGPGVRWSGALVDGPVHEALGRAGAGLAPLATWGRPKLGIVTGSNPFFTLTAGEVRAAGLRDDEVLPIVPPGSSHLRRLEFTEADWLAQTAGDARVYLFRPAGRELSDGARRLIGVGMQAGVDAAYKCRVRDPWWLVPDSVPPDLMVTYMNHETVQLATNAANVRVLNSVHGISLTTWPELGRELLPLAALNSVTMLSAELTGRTFGGGMLQVLPGEAAELLVPGPDLVAGVADGLRAARGEVLSVLAADGPAAAAELVDEVLFARSGSGGVTAADLRTVRRARLRLAQSRIARSRRVVAAAGARP